MFRKPAVLLVLFTLAACSSSAALTPEQRAIKSNCVAGDYAACSDLGHQMAAQRAGG